jgi:branched-chain amino acid transport system permease protein
MLLAGVVLGGLGSLDGALIGAALLTFLPQVVTGIGQDAGLSDLQAAELAPLALGLTLMLVILLAPTGIAGGVRTYLRKRRERAAGSAPSRPVPNPLSGKSEEERGGKQ